MNKKKREEEERILKEMLSSSDGDKKEKNSISHSDTPSKSNNVESDDDVIRCPKCGYVLPSRTTCPRCGYNGYVPMSKAETKKIKLILYPILTVIVIVVILWQKGVFG